MMLGKKTLLSTVASVGFVLALAGPLTVAPPNVEPVLAQADTKGEISLDIFHDRLASHGDWVQFEDGYVWVPAKVAAGWQPYTRGHWVFAKGIGWTWVSDEPWGWATYHYGRWGHKDDIGWYWVPGTVWAPAWVSWRKSNKHVAWAPLPPKHNAIYVDASVDVEPEEIPTLYWHVVPVEAFVSPNLVTEIIDEEETEVIIRETRAVGTVQLRNNIVVNDVIEPEFIEKEAKTKVVVHEVREARDLDEAGKVSEREIVIFNAPVEREAAKSWKPKEAKSIDEVRTEKKAGPTEDKGKAAVGEELPTGDKAAKVKTDEMKAKEDEKARVETKTDEMSSEGATAATPSAADETTLKKEKGKSEEKKVKEESATKDEDQKVKEESAGDETTVKKESAKTKADGTKTKKESAKTKTDEATESKTPKNDQGQAEGKSEETTKRKKSSSATAQDSDPSGATGATGSDEAKEPAKKKAERKKGGAEGATEKAPEEQLPQQ